MKLYSLKKNNKIGYIIYSISFQSPLEQLAQIEEELSREHFKGDVYFDFLLSNGNNHNRYLKAFFDGQKFNLKTFQVVDKPMKQLIKESNLFYTHNPQLLENSILPRSVKFMIKKGYTIPKLSLSLPTAKAGGVLTAVSRVSPYLSHEATTVTASTLVDPSSACEPLCLRFSPKLASLCLPLAVSFSLDTARHRSDSAPGHASTAWLVSRLVPDTKRARYAEYKSLCILVPHSQSCQRWDKGFLV